MNLLNHLGQRKRQSRWWNAKEEEMDVAAVDQLRLGNAALLFGLMEGSADESEASRLVSFLWDPRHLVGQAASPAINYWPQMFPQSCSEKKKKDCAEPKLLALVVPCPQRKCFWFGNT